MSKNPTRENVKVVCRIRPENEKEINSGHKTCIRQDATTMEIFGDDGSHSFVFDQIFGPSCTQDDIFQYAAMPLINDVLSGYNATIFACM
jgi:kinesin family protein 5